MKTSEKLAHLSQAARDVYLAFLKFGPVDDGSEAGRNFEEKLDKLRDVMIEIGAFDSA